MNKNRLPIGVFDSGMGGLTVLSALKLAMPDESFIYLGDTARLPYGTKSATTVQQYALQMVKILVKRHIKALVIACNTATTAALPHLQAILPDMPIIGVVVPGAKAVVTATKNHHIMVFATETTIASNAYQRLIIEQLPQAKIRTRSCSILVALAEEGMVSNAIAKEAIKFYLSEFTNQDTLLLGCTHFPVFKSLLASLLPPGVNIIDSAEATAKSLKSVLTHCNLLASKSTGDQLTSVNYLVTDSVVRFQKVGEIFLGEPLSAQQVELVDACVSQSD